MTGFGRQAAGAPGREAASVAHFDHWPMPAASSQKVEN
jgi:hypothetical protein